MANFCPSTVTECKERLLVSSRMYPSVFLTLFLYRVHSNIIIPVGYEINLLRVNVALNIPFTIFFFFSFLSACQMNLHQRILFFNTAKNPFKLYESEWNWSVYDVTRDELFFNSDPWTNTFEKHLFGLSSFLTYFFLPCGY